MKEIGFGTSLKLDVHIEQAEEHFEELGWKLCDATEFNRQQGGEIAEEKNGKVKEIGKGL